MQHGSTLYSLGISYFAYGTIKQGRKVQAYYFKLCKPLTPEQLSALREVYPDVHTGHSQYMYAPEIITNVVYFLSKAEIKRQSI